MRATRKEKVSKKALMTLKSKVQGKRVEDKVAIRGKTRSQTLRALATSRNVHCKDVRDFAPGNTIDKNVGNVVESEIL